MTDTAPLSDPFGTGFSVNGPQTDQYRRGSKAPVTVSRSAVTGAPNFSGGSVTNTPVVIIGGIPLNTPMNQAYAAQNGWHGVSWPVPHPPDSSVVMMECRSCGGLMWVGPRAHDAHTRITDALVMCMLCVLLSNCGDISVIVRLSGGSGK